MFRHLSIDDFAIPWTLWACSAKHKLAGRSWLTILTRMAKYGRYPMAWTRPKLREICIGMEINGYFAAKL